MSIARQALWTLTAAALAWVGTESAYAATSPGYQALKDFREGSGRPDAVQNRFFLKTGRFELAPMVGYVPNNPFAKRYVGGVMVAYHFSEELAAEASVSYSPDLGLNDLKGLTYTLVQIAQTGSTTDDFAQPLDKVTLSASFAARWAPVYGKINLLGETVLNFDFYGVAGVGMISKVNYYATYQDDPNNPLQIKTSGTQEAKPTPVLGLGSDFFLNQVMALKIDARMSLYVDNVPDYEPETANPTDSDQRLYSNFVASVGLSFYFPNMKPRLYNF